MFECTKCNQKCRETPTGISKVIPGVWHIDHVIYHRDIDGVCEECGEGPGLVMIHYEDWYSPAVERFLSVFE